jgi:hypothetical protein
MERRRAFRPCVKPGGDTDSGRTESPQWRVRSGVCAAPDWEFATDKFELK